MKNRNFYIISGLVMFLCMGTIYSWGVFQRPLVEALMANHNQEVSSTLASMPYTVFLLVYAFFMPVSGRYIKKVNPKLLSIIGCLCISVAWILASFATNIHFIIATYGVLGGIGVGIVYGIPIAVVTEWFPDKKGFAVGLTLLGFGLSPFITAPLANRLIEGFGVFTAFRILGITFAVILPLLSLTLKFPDKPKTKSTQDLIDSNDFTPKEMLKTKTFYIIWICYVIGSFSGLMIIGLSSTYAQEVISLTPAVAAIFTSIFAVFNGIGRPLFGALTDKLGSQKTIIISYILIITAGVLSLTFKDSPLVFGISFAIVWLNLGGWQAIVPATTANIFGKVNYSSNYGIIFTAYGIGALIQGVISGYLKEQFGSYLYVFYPVVGLCLVGIVLSGLFIKNPESNSKPVLAD